MNVTTVLFDLDGLLADTEMLHCAAYQEALRAHGVELSEAVYRECWIRRGRGVTDFLRERGLALDVPSLRREKALRYASLVESRCAAMPGAIGLLERLKGRKAVGLASSAYGDAVRAVLRKLGIADWFGCIVTGSDVQRVKPFPDIFLEAAQRLKARPGECAVIEDAEKGVLAAKAAGMRCIAVPSSHTADNDFSMADVVVDSLEKVTIELIEGRS